MNTDGLGFPMKRFLLFLFFAALGGSVSNAGEVAFRTDQSKDKQLPWFQTVPGEFPPEGSAHYFSGELIQIDHVRRRGVIRVDRTDSQRRSHWDLPVDFRMLPYGSIRYHGAAAALRDIPLGTHLHGLFYIKDKDEEIPTIFYYRMSIEAEFTKAFLLEDDFSHNMRQGRYWRLDEVDKKAKKLHVTAVDKDGGNPDRKPTLFDLIPITRFWMGNELVKLDQLEKGQLLQINITWATLYGPGRCLDIWIDEESRKQATKRQLELHRYHTKLHGMPGYVTAVDNQEGIVTVTLFGGYDEALYKDIRNSENISTVVAEPSLMTYDQKVDRKRGQQIGFTEVPKVPGSSGYQVQVKPDDLLEGFRPGRVVKLFPIGWEVMTLPMEEKLFPARD